MMSDGNGPNRQIVAHNAAVEAEKQNKHFLKNLEAGRTVIFAVNVPLVPNAQGVLGWDLSDIRILAPEFPKTLVTAVELSVENWAEATRQRLNRQRIVAP